MARPQPPKIKVLQRQRQKLLQQLSSFPLLIRGSVFERFSTCSRPHCACHKGKRHGPRAYVAVTRGKAQRQHYIPKSQCKAVRRGIKQYHRVRQILDLVTEINLQLMRQDALDEDAYG